MLKLHARRNRSAKVTGSREMSLEAQACLLWGQLSPAESALLLAIQHESSHASDVGNELAPLVTAPLSSPDAVVRAELLRWLCSADKAGSAIGATGIRIRHARIDGMLNLESISCSFPLHFQDCEILGAIRLDHAKLPYVRIINSTVNELSAVRLRLDGSLILNGLRTSGPLKLDGAAIKGNLQLNKANLSNVGGCALNLEGAEIGGAVNMRDGFRCHGSIRVYATEIRKNLECQGLVVHLGSECALLIESSKIGGSLLLRKGFRALGQVRMYETTVEGTLDLELARLAARRKLALEIQGVRVKGSVLLRGTGAKHHFRAIGGVRLTRSSIDGHLDLAYSSIRARRRAAADLVDLKIEGRLNALGAQINGELLLARSKVGNDVNFREARFIRPGEYAISARGFHCGGSLLFGRQFMALGGVQFYGAHIGDEFDAEGSQFELPGKVALELSETNIQRAARCMNIKVSGVLKWSGGRIGSHLFLSKGILKEDVDLTRLHVNGSLMLNGAKVTGKLRADGLRCKGSLFLDGGFEARGGAFFYGAEVEGDFNSLKGAYGAVDGPALNLSRARIGGHVLLQDISTSGTVFLRLARVEGQLSLSRANIVGKRGVAVDANGCAIGGDALFDQGFKAKGAILLERSHIGGDLDLSTCLVRNNRQIAVSLTAASIHGDFYAGWTFNLHSRFAEARLLGGISAARATIEGSVDLSGMWVLRGGNNSLLFERLRVKGSLDLRPSFKTNGGIDLRDASIGSLLDASRPWSPAQALSVNGLTYGAIVPAESTQRLQWLQDRRSIGTWRSFDDPEDTDAADSISLQPYEQLVQALKRQGHERDARKVAIAKQAFIGTHTISGRAAKLLHALYGVTMRFGYQPQRALIIAAFFLILLCFFFYTGASSLMTPVNPLAQQALKSKKPLPEGYPSFSPVAYSVEMFVPILNLQQKESWRPDDRAVCDPGPEHCGFWLRVYLWIHMAAGWIITTLAVAGFTGLVRKD